MDALTFIISKSRPPKAWSEVFGEYGYTPQYKNATLYIPKGCRRQYEKTNGWNLFERIVEVDDIDNIPSFKRKVVVEEGTGTWCGWCPRGIVGLRETFERHPDDFIPIAVHVQDEMYTDDYMPLIEQKFGNYPICIMNRRYVFDPNAEAIEYYFGIGSETSNAAIKMSAQWVDETKKEVKVNTATSFAYDMPDDYRIAYVITENKVGPYSQVNYYSGGSGGEMGGFENEPNKVSIYFDHVARSISNVNGTRRTVPEGPLGGEVYQYSHVLEIPDNVQNIENIELTVLLINQETLFIENADRISMKDILGHDATIVRSIPSSVTNEEKWYTLNGQVMSDRPRKKGVYVRGREKIIVK